MGSKAIFLGMAAIFLVAQPAWAQSTVGEVLQKGGVKLSADELKTLMPGATYGGFNTLGGQFSLNLQSDGTLSGTGTGGRVQAGLKGKWNISDDGKWCFDYLNLTNHNTEKNCVFIYKAADQYFISTGDAAGAGVIARTIRK